MTGRPLRVAVLDDYFGFARTRVDWSALDGDAELVFFADRCATEADVVDRLADFDAVVLMRERTALPASTLDRLPSLRLIVTTGTVNPALDLGRAHERGVVVCATRGKDTGPAELTWALILGLARNIPAEDRTVRAGGWGAGMGLRLAGRTLGLFGLGRIGASVARTGRDGFGMRTIAWSPSLTPARAAEQGAESVDRERLFREADVLCVHARLPAGAPPAIGVAEFALMKPSALLVNTARARVVDEAALVAALRNRRIRGAGLDVYHQEPLRRDHPLRTLPHTVLTAHAGHVTEERHGETYATAARLIRAYLDGVPENLVPAAV
jgi:phosphoglycerate dehydrogenase-like enzyme